MKWKNPIELPNNPYSAEALQRRLSRTSVSKFDRDIERLAGKLQKDDTRAVAKTDQPLKTVSVENVLNSGRYLNLDDLNK